MLSKQEITNSQSPVIQAVLDIDFGNIQQSPTYVRNLVLSLFNEGLIPKDASLSSVGNGNKLRMNLSFWQVQDQLLMWEGVYLANNTSVVNQKYGDLNNATALTSDAVVEIKSKKEGFNQQAANGGGVDILWSIDASGSMSEEQANLANGAEQFFNTLNTAGLDYRLAVNTQGGNYRGYSCNTLRQTSLGSNYIDNKTPNALGEWKKLAQPGTSDSATETGFYCTREVDMKGFTRPNAKQLVVFVSDEPENETVQNLKPSSAPYSYQKRDFNDYKKYFTNTGATYFAIVGLGSIIKPTFNSPVDLNANGDFSCSGKGGNAEGGAHFKEIANSTGGTTASICAEASSWTIVFNKILERATGLASNFKLQHSPLPSTVKVKVDGQEILRDVNHQNGFDVIYVQDEASLVFYGNKLPHKGNNIEVNYDYVTHTIAIRK